MRCLCTLKTVRAVHEGVLARDEGGDAGGPRVQ